MIQPTTTSPQRAARWWRYPMVWLVVGVPMAAIAACIVTAIIVLRHPDPPLPPSVLQAHPVDDETLATQQSTSVSTLPAMTARNHAARPVSGASNAGGGSAKALCERLSLRREPC